jgi:hypothetical protein
MATSTLQIAELGERFDAATLRELYGVDVVAGESNLDTKDGKTCIPCLVREKYVGANPKR